MKPRRLTIFKVLALSAASHLSSADTIYWDGSLTGATALWATAGAWSSSDSETTPDPAAAPGSGDLAVFSASTVSAAQTILLNAGHSAQGLSFVLEGVNHTLTSNNTTARTLTLGTSGITVAETAGNVTIGGTNILHLSLAGSQEWNVGAGRTLTIANTIGGAQPFTKTGAGTLTLNGSSNHTGGFTLAEGLLRLNHAGSLGSATGDFVIRGGTIQNASTSSPLTIGVNKPIRIEGNFTYTVPTNGNGALTLGGGNVTLAPLSGSSITVTNTSGIIAFNGPVSGEGIGIAKSGGGTLALMGNNTYTGPTTLGTSANLRVNGASGIATTNVFLNGGLLELGGPLIENNIIELGTGPGQVRFKSGAATTAESAHGGFSSASGYRKISLTSEGVPNAPLVWGETPHFMSAPAWGASNGIFLLSTNLSAGTVELTNDLDFGDRNRRFSIRDGSPVTAPDAVLSGKLTNGQLSLQGGGTLFVSNPENTLSGVTDITNNSVLRVPRIEGYLGTSRVILNGGILELSEDTEITLGDQPGQVSFGSGGGGFSTYGTNRTVSIGAPDTPLIWGDSAFLASGGNLILSASSSESVTTFANSIDLGTSLRSFTVANGGNAVDAVLTGVLSGGAGGGVHLAAGSGSLLLSNPANSYTGPTQISSGALVIDSISNGGVNSPIGASSNAASNFLFTGGGLRYTGPGDTTDRLIEVRSNATLNASGSGPLEFSNTSPNAFTSNSASAVTRTFSLSGFSPGVNVFNSGITNSTAASNNITALTKTGSGIWSVGGNNTYTGATLVNAGELILDYSGGNTPVGNDTIVTFDNSRLTLKGKPTGTTAASISNLRLGNGANGISNIFKLDSNGGSGIALTLSTLSGNATSGNALNSNFIDISSSPGNSITVDALANGLSLINNVLIANASGTTPVGGRSIVVVKDSAGYGFARIPGPLPAQLGRLDHTTTLPLSDATSDVAGHFRLNYDEMTPDSGDVPGGRKLVRTEKFVYSTLAIEATGGPVHLDIADNDFGETTSNNGRGILITGDHDVSLTTAGTTANTFYSPFIYHHGSGRFDFNLPLPSGFSIIAGGSGFYDYNGAISSTDARFYIDGSHFRFSLTADFSTLTGGGIWVGDDGIIEIAGDLNGEAPGDFSNPIGNAGGNVRLTGNSGFSAFGGDRVANFGGAGAQLIWGSDRFLTSSGGGDSDQTFRLSSTRSDSTIEIVNPIALNARDRVIEVADGSAAVDAILSGEISGLGAGIIKRGTGTLVLDGTNTYNGTTVVEAGTLRLTKATLADISTVRISAAAGARLDLSHGQTDTIAALIVDGSPLPDGIYDTENLSSAITGSGKLNVGGVPGGTTPYQDWAAANNLPEGKDLPEQDADDDGVQNIVEYAVGSDPMAPAGSVFNQVAGGFAFTRAPGRTDITLILETNDNLSSTWSEIARSTAGEPFVPSGTHPAINVNETSGTVSFTGLPVAGENRNFYRLRVVQP